MSSADHALHRSYLYAPGSAPDVARKALRSGADAVVVDLEDAVAPRSKGDARLAVGSLLDDWAAAAAGPGGQDVPVAPPRPDVHVRINRDGDGYDDADLDAVVRPGLDAIRLPKVETAASVRAVASALDRLERDRGLAAGAIGLYLTVESALGAVAIGRTLVASVRVVRAAIGTADLLADLGAVGDDDLATLHVRSQLVVESRAAGVGPPIDSVHTDLDDEGGLRRAATRARSLGFFGKSLVHPRQLPAVHDVFAPTTDEIARAEALIEALAEADADGTGAVVSAGDFVDAAVVARARALLALRRDP